MNLRKEQISSAIHPSPCEINTSTHNSSIYKYTGQTTRNRSVHIANVLAHVRTFCNILNPLFGGFLIVNSFITLNNALNYATNFPHTICNSALVSLTVASSWVQCAS